MFRSADTRPSNRPLVASPTSSRAGHRAEGRTRRLGSGWARGAACTLAGLPVVLAGCGVLVTEQSRTTGLAEGFAAAWSTGRLADAAALTDDPDAAEAALRRTTDQMGVPPDLVQATADTSDNTVEARLTWSLDAGRTWTYTTTWHMLSGDGRQLDWRPSVIHPAILEGQSLTVRRQPGQRGDPLDRTGRPLLLAVADSGTTQALTGLYPPGSTFKAITAAAVLGAGLAELDTLVPCPETTTVNGQRIRNDPGVGDRGTITLQQAFAHSCNTSFIGYSGELAPEAFPSTAEQFGIGVDFVLPGAATNSGSAPVPASANEAAEDSIGQGRIQASPFAMAMVAASVAHGSLPRPVLVQGEPATADRAVPAPDPRLLDALRQMMRSVVTYGSARSLAHLGEVYGKTGTAQFGDGTSAHGWFVGYRGDLAFAVFVEAGESSHGTAVPVAETFLERLP